MEDGSIPSVTRYPLPLYKNEWQNLHPEPTFDSLTRVDLNVNSTKKHCFIYFRSILSVTYHLTRAITFNPTPPFYTTTLFKLPTFFFLRPIIDDYSTPP